MAQRAQRMGPNKGAIMFEKLVSMLLTPSHYSGRAQMPAGITADGLGAALAAAPWLAKVLATLVDLGHSVYLRTGESLIAGCKIMVGLHGRPLVCLYRLQSWGDGRRGLRVYTNTVPYRAIVGSNAVVPAPIAAIEGAGLVVQNHAGHGSVSVGLPADNNAAERALATALSVVFGAIGYAATRNGLLLVHCKPAEATEAKPAEATEAKPAEATEAKPAEATEAKPVVPNKPTAPISARSLARKAAQAAK